jgi:hypothetical protein
VIDCLGVSGIGAKCEGLGGNDRGDVDIDNFSCLAKGNHVLVELPNCQFAADLTPALSGDLIDEVDGAVEGVGLEERPILLSVNAVNGGFDVVDGPCFQQFSGFLDVVDYMN